MAQKYPIIAVIGDRGDGKTLTTTAISVSMHLIDGLNIFANYEIKGVPYRHIDFETLSDFPEWLRDGVIVYDELHVGFDAYNFFSTQVKDMTLFITQLRKRRLTFIFTTQIFIQVPKRLRLLTNYIFECRQTDMEGTVKILVFDRSKMEDEGYIGTKYLLGEQFYKNYNTEEIITD